MSSHDGAGSREAGPHAGSVFKVVCKLLYSSIRASVAGFYVRGLLSDVQRKNAEAMALDQNVAPRTLRRFLESIVWDEQKLRDRCQQMIASEHADEEAIGCVDETGTAKSGSETAGVKRQYNGNRGKIENGINNVALAYSAPVFNCLLNARLYLPREWADDAVR